MTNLDIIKSAYNEFNNGNIEAAKKIITRINNNFNLQHDEFYISLDAKVYAPYANSCNELIENNRAELIGDVSLMTKQEITIVIGFKTIEPVDFLAGDEDMGDEDQFFYGHYNAVVNNEGLCSGTVTYANRFDSKAPAKLVEKWLKAEFGAVNY